MPMQPTDLLSTMTRKSGREFWCVIVRPGSTARILYPSQIWLFKPSMRIAYSTPAQYLLSKVGNIHGAKVLYRILGPETASTDLTRYVRSQLVAGCSFVLTIPQPKYRLQISRFPASGASILSIKHMS